VVDILPIRRVSLRTAGYHSPKMSSVGGPEACSELRFAGTR